MAKLIDINYISLLRTVQRIEERKIVQKRDKAIGLVQLDYAPDKGTCHQAEKWLPILRSVIIFANELSLCGMAPA